MTHDELQQELVRINNMDYTQIMLKARNHRHYKHYTLTQYHMIGGAIESRLNDYGYKLENACCGTFNIVKSNGEQINVRKPE